MDQEEIPFRIGNLHFYSIIECQGAGDMEKRGTLYSFIISDLLRSSSFDYFQEVFLSFLSFLSCLPCFGFLIFMTLETFEPDEHISMEVQQLQQQQTTA